MTVFKYVNKSNVEQFLPFGEGSISVLPSGSYVGYEELNSWVPLADGLVFDRYVDGVLSNMAAAELAKRAAVLYPETGRVQYYSTITVSQLAGIVAGFPSIYYIVGETCAPNSARAIVNDSSVAYSGATIGTVVADGGSNIVPVYYDGTDWRIG